VRITASGSFDLSKSPSTRQRTIELPDCSKASSISSVDVVAEDLLVGPCPNGRMTEELALGVIDEGVGRQRRHEHIGVMVVMGCDVIEDDLR